MGELDLDSYVSDSTSEEVKNNIAYHIHTVV